MRARALLAVCVCAIAFVTGAQAASVPRLTLVDRSPLVVAGIGFGARELVVVTVRAPSLVVNRTVRVSESGRFRTSVAGLSLTGRLRCAHGLTIVARSQRGALVLWHPQRLPDCAAPPLHPA